MDSLPNLIVEPPTPDPEARPNLASWYTPGLSDGLGDRLLMFDNTHAASLELLRFRREFTAVPGFEAALRRRVDDLADFSHPSLARVRTVKWLGDGDGLALVSNHTIGRRLSELLHDARGPKLATELIRQVAPVLATLEQQSPGFAHGALSPDRIVVTPEGRLVVVEHVLGAAVEALRLPARRLRHELGIAVPLGSAESVLDGRQDVVQLGYIALSLLLGRRVDPADDRQHVERLLDDAARPGPGRAESPSYLRHWLERALQVHASRFTSANDAHLALEGWQEDRDRSPELSLMPWEIRTPTELPESQPVQVEPPTPAELPESQPVQVEPRTAAELPESQLLQVEPSSLDTSADFRYEVEIERSRIVELLRRRAFTFERRPRTSTTDSAEAVELPRLSTDQAAEATAVSRAARRSLPKVVRWALAGLSAVAVAEALVIAGLMVDARPANTNVATMPTPAATQGRLEISSDPPGARVVVDGSRRGITPVSVLVGAGEHTVVITRGGATTRRTVNVAAGGTSALIASFTVDVSTR